MQGYASREAALAILLEQETTGAFLKDLFAIHTSELPKQDRGLVREICFGVIRNRSLLDFNIDAHATKKPGPGALRCLLRLSAYQILFLEVPDFAAVNLGVELAKRGIGKHQAGFVNAVLKKVAAAGLQKVPGETLKAQAINFSHPEWLVRRWHKRLGPLGVRKALERNNQEAPLYARVNPARATVAEAQAGLTALGAAVDPDPEAPLFLRLSGSGAAEAALHSELFARGALAIQDPAAALIARLAAWKPSESLLDLCAAPGGKAACILESGHPPAHPLICNDISFRRLRRIRDAIDRLGHTSLAPVVMDPAKPALRGRFDCIIVDAPCSNLGVIRRRPEARWRHSPDDFARLAALQTELLIAAAGLASAHGRILYATCSPEDEETLEVVRAFLGTHPDWRLENAGDFLPAWAVKQGCLWLHPGESEYDGFFAARLARGG